MKIRVREKIAEHTVIAELHRTMNSVKGSVYSESMSQCTEDEILHQLSDQGVTKVERMKRRENGELLAAHRYILTFNRTKLPSLIKLASWHH